MFGGQTLAGQAQGFSQGLGAGAAMVPQLQVAPPPNGGLVSALGHLQESTVALHEAIGQLTARLQRVLLPEGPVGATAQGKDAPAPAKCDLALTVESLDRAVREAVGRIGYLQDRVDA